jgi:hypothetical protein
MSILTLVFALLLSGSSSVTVHTNEVIGGGPITAPQAVAAPANPPTVDSISGGGPTSGRQASKPLPGMTVHDVSSGGPIL